jgi:hypothetical protein
MWSPSATLIQGPSRDSVACDRERKLRGDFDPVGFGEWDELVPEIR